MNPTKILGWFLAVILVPFVALQLMVLLIDPWAIKETYFLFIGAPQFHNLTLLVLSVETLLLWFTSKVSNAFERAEAVVIRLFCSVGFYEVVWHFGNGIKLGTNYIFTWQWWFVNTTLLDYFGLLTVLSIVLLAVHNRMYKIKPISKVAFFAFLAVFVLSFAIQGYMGLDWSPLAIRYNMPVLWAFTKVVGYGMWLFI